MLSHEWMRKRERRARSAAHGPSYEQHGSEGMTEGEAEGVVGLEEAGAWVERSLPRTAASESAAGAHGVAADTVETTEGVVAGESSAAGVIPDERVEVPGSAPAPGTERADESRPRRGRRATRRAVQDRRRALERLDVPYESLRERLEAVLAHQAQLPLDIEARQAVSRGVEGSPRETREALVQRLLDPTLTLEEVSTLLGVCRTTVRRYTDRGVLRCFRTPGNQRRFNLSDVLDFMERQARGE